MTIIDKFGPFIIHSISSYIEFGPFYIMSGKLWSTKLQIWTFDYSLYRTIYFCARYHIVKDNNFGPLLFINADKVTNVGPFIIPTICLLIEYGPFYIVKCQHFGPSRKAQHLELFLKRIVISAKVTNLDLLLFIISDH